MLHLIDVHSFLSNRFASRTMAATSWQLTVREASPSSSSSPPPLGRERVFGHSTTALLAILTEEDGLGGFSSGSWIAAQIMLSEHLRSDPRPGFLVDLSMVGLEERGGIMPSSSISISGPSANPLALQSHSLLLRKCGCDICQF